MNPTPPRVSSGVLAALVWPALSTCSRPEGYVEPWLGSWSGATDWSDGYGDHQRAILRDVTATGDRSPALRATGSLMTGPTTLGLACG